MNVLTLSKQKTKKIKTKLQSTPILIKVPAFLYFFLKIDSSQECFNLKRKVTANTQDIVFSLTTHISSK